MNRERESGENAPARLRDAVGANQPTGLAGALRDAATGHQPTGAQLGDLRRALAVALARPGGGAAPRAATPRTRVALRGALAVAVLAVGAGALWYGIAGPTASSPTEPGAIGAVAPAPVAPVETFAAPTAPAATAPAAASPAPDRSALAPLELRSRHTAPDRAARRDDELRLLSRAQQALISEPAVALALAERHRRLFPAGVLAQEREVIAIDALRGLRRTDDAEARVRQFRARYPHSAHLPRVEGQRL